MIEEKTISLKEKMWELEDIPDRVNLMKDWYKDETCYIVSAGPSLKNFEKEWLRERGNPYKKNIYDSNGNIAIDFGVYGAPETFLINKEGIIIHKHVGPIDETYYNKII